MYLNKGKSIDSLYSSSMDSEKEDEERESDQSTDTDYDVKRSILIRDIPKISKFNVYGTKDVHDFFKEYESYCKEKFSENKGFWVKELGEFLEGRMLDFYKAVVSVGEPKYEVVKQRIEDQVRRVKGGVKYRKVNDFDKARMGKNERLDLYAHRLETLARKKFGDEDVNENKLLMKKFLETIPTSVAEFINARRKEKMRWARERLRWEDVLEIVEDREFNVPERSENEQIHVFSGRSENRGPPTQYKSYRDALRANPYEVMVKFLEDFYGGTPQMGVRMVNQRRRMNGNVSRNAQSGQGNQANVNGQNADTNVQNRVVTCFRCGKVGHMISECRWANGACFSCGQVGHLANSCNNSQFGRVQEVWWFGSLGAGLPTRCENDENCMW
ncbi:hypothetical protein Avbf_04773 [Armadillidium vulgare]|nr:hypothetical protein Avbf_04773 [Armadillidium vulgare]